MKKGFSLLELSIVLVIIGLIAGGIVAGSSMIRAAELRAIITEQQQYETAINTFRDKYLGVPGDLKNAGDFWGYPSGSEANCPSTGGTGSETCDGNGDNIIDNEPTATALDYDERYMFWQHLANANLISGTYNGRTGGSGWTHHELGENSPESKLSGAGWTVNDLGTSSNSLYTFNGSYGNSMWIGGGANNSAPNALLLTSSEAWNFDKKIDDGKPATGKVVARHRANCAIAADGSALTTAAADAAEIDATYNLASDDINCVPLVRNVF